MSLAGVPSAFKSLIGATTKLRSSGSKEAKSSRPSKPSGLEKPILGA